MFSVTAVGAVTKGALNQASSSGQNFQLKIPSTSWVEPVVY